MTGTINGRITLYHDVMIYDYNHLLQHLATNIKTRRKELGITQEALALDAGIDRTYISQIERGISVRADKIIVA